MMQEPVQQEPVKRKINLRIAIACAAFTATMIGVAYASVPLYELFCRVTGFGGTTQVAESQSDTVLERTIKVRFDANVGAGLPWQFKPEVREVELKIGETRQIGYVVTNPSDRETWGRASFNVTPLQAGSYFNKIACFCFTDTGLEPGDKLDMPVVFFIDPEIVNDPDLANTTTITLSYTFFPIDAPEVPLAAVGEKAEGRKDDNTL